MHTTHMYTLTHTHTHTQTQTHSPFINGSEAENQVIMTIITNTSREGIEEAIASKVTMQCDCEVTKVERYGKLALNTQILIGI